MGDNPFAKKGDGAKPSAGKRAPVNNREDLEKAIKAVEAAKGGEAGKKAVRKFLIFRAKLLKLSKLIPSSWADDGTVKSK